MAPLSPDRHPRPDLRICALLVAGDLLVTALAVAYFAELTGFSWFRITRDPNVGERYQHAKLLGIVVAGVWVFWRTRQPVYAAITALFLAVLVDDAGKLHEEMGGVLVPILGLEPSLGLRARDFGEVLFLASWAVPLILLAVVAYRRSDASAQYVARVTAVAVAALATFGVGADMVHQMGGSAALRYGWDVDAVKFALAVVEEGGELVVMSVIVAGVFFLVQSLSAGPAGATEPSRRGGGVRALPRLD